jgi:nucleoside-diphosphate-sugar epimerase
MEQQHPTSGIHVVAGAGPLGRHVVDELVRRGLPVRVVTRSGGGVAHPGVERVRADVTNVDEARGACAGAAVVYGCAQPGYAHWVDQFPPIQRGLLEGAAAAGAVFVAAENLYLYAPGQAVLTEDLPYEPTTRKGAVRAAMAREVLDAHTSGRVRTTAGRASDFYGPLVEGSAVGDRFFPRIVAGKSVSMVGDLDAPHTYTYIGDFARALVVLGTDERAWGQGWHVPSAPTLTTRQLAELAYRVAGTSGKVKHLPAISLRAAGLFVPEAKETVEMLYEFDEPFVMSHERFAATYGDLHTPHEEALAATIAWYRQRARSKAA